MESTITEPSPPVTEKTARTPSEVGATIVEDTQAALHEGARLIVEAGTVVIEATKVAVHDVVDASQHLGHDAKKAVTPGHETPTVTAPVVTPTPSA